MKLFLALLPATVVVFLLAFWVVVVGAAYWKVRIHHSPFLFRSERIGFRAMNRGESVSAGILSWAWGSVDSVTTIASLVRQENWRSFHESRNWPKVGQFSSAKVKRLDSYQQWKWRAIITKTTTPCWRWPRYLVSSFWLLTRGMYSLGSRTLAVVLASPFHFNVGLMPLRHFNELTAEILRSLRRCFGVKGSLSA